jgi:Cu-Zn family superoxide dismutase
MRLPCLACAVVLLAACSSSPRQPPAAAPTATAPMASSGTVARAEAALAPASASLVSGRLVLLPVEGGVRITGTLGSLPANQAVAFHIHERGDCSAVDASSAGGHFNPQAQAHGRNGHGAHHLGDMDNLQANGRGQADVDLRVPGLVLGGGAGNDILGRALVVHAQADDYRSQPAGNAGARVACGVIRATAP